ncbi:hypothetical protein FOE78_22665 [Microlunatus elymi]|uniref:Uncharacterized protein n=1 Tax=Microlunatus elymi TaxID=2596828 RepID=A0A516Q4M6_9ACTN|nr:hypothetical protein [Microlunatus elymi]QDP98335.1 hypothetical protein FOE78_22665 [Microlunatus elymi]
MSASPTPSSASRLVSGRELDQSLRDRQANGRNTLPQFGRLLAATQTSGPDHLAVDLTGVRGSVIGVFVCRGPGDGPTFSAKRGTTSILWTRSSGCDDTNLFSAQSPAIPGGSGHAVLRVDASRDIEYAFVLEEVGTST